MAKKLIESPADYSTDKGTGGSGSNTVNGEPGYPKRTESKGAVDEVVRDGEIGKLINQG